MIKEMKAEEYRKMSKEELMNKLRDLRIEVVKLRGQKKLHTLNKPSALRNARKEIARILTVLKEKEGR